MNLRFLTESHNAKRALLMQEKLRHISPNSVIHIMLSQYFLKLNLDSICGYRYLTVPSNGSIYIRSPNYPSNFGNNEDCILTLQTAALNEVINIQIINFATENGPDY